MYANNVWVFLDTLPNEASQMRQSVPYVHAYSRQSTMPLYNAARWKNAQLISFYKYRISSPISSRGLFDQIPYIPRPLQPLLVLRITTQCLAAENDSQVLGEPNGVLGAAEQRARPPADDAPLLDCVDTPLDKQLLVAAGERSFLCVPERLECRDEILKGRIQADEDVDGPCDVCVEDEVSRVCVSIVCVVLDVVLQEQLKNDVDREDVLVQVDASADFLDLDCERLPWLWQPGGEGLPVYLLDQVGPRVANIGDIAVVCGVVDEQANVVVPSLIGVVVVQLCVLVSDSVYVSKNLPRLAVGSDRSGAQPPVPCELDP